MAEIKREPVKIVVGDIEYEAFDENHTWADIARWVRKNEVDAASLVQLLGAVYPETPQ